MLPNCVDVLQDHKEYKMLLDNLSQTFSHILICNNNENKNKNYVQLTHILPTNRNMVF